MTHNRRHSCGSHHYHRKQDKPLDRLLCDGRILALCILPCGRRYRVPLASSSASCKVSVPPLGCGSDLITDLVGPHSVDLHVALRRLVSLDADAVQLVREVLFIDWTCHAVRELQECGGHGKLAFAKALHCLLGGVLR